MVEKEVEVGRHHRGGGARGEVGFETYLLPPSILTRVIGQI